MIHFNVASEKKLKDSSLFPQLLTSVFTFNVIIMVEKGNHHVENLLDHGLCQHILINKNS